MTLVPGNGFSIGSLGLLGDGFSIGSLGLLEVVAGGDGSSVLFIRRPSPPRLVVDEDEDELSLILSLAVARRT